MTETEIPENQERACTKCGGLVVTILETAAIFCASCLEAIRCARHPERKLESNEEADEWFTTKDWSRSKGDFILHHYCPDCRVKFQKGELV